MSTLEDLLAKCSKSGMFQIVDFNKFNDLLMIHSSSVMEGSTLTLHETEMLITENITPEGRPLEHSLMTKDHYTALQFVNTIATSVGLILTHDLVRQIASKVMRHTGDRVNTPLGTYDKAESEYRLNNVRSTGGHYYLNYDKVLPRMEQLFQKVNQTVLRIQSPDDVFTLASYAHLEFLTIHPLGDGNGRTARLLHNLILLNKGLPILIIDAAKKGKYIEAIKTSREQESIDTFNNFLKGEYIAYWGKELSLYEAKTKDKGQGLTFSIRELD